MAGEASGTSAKFLDSAKLCAPLISVECPRSYLPILNKTTNRWKTKNKENSPDQEYSLHQGPRCSGLQPSPRSRPHLRGNPFPTTGVQFAPSEPPMLSVTNQPHARGRGNGGWCTAEVGVRRVLDPQVSIKHGGVAYTEYIHA